MADIKKLVKQDIASLKADRQELINKVNTEEGKQDAADIYDQIDLYNAVINVIVRSSAGVSPVTTNELEGEVLDLYNAKEEKEEIIEEVLEEAPKPKKRSIRSIFRGN